MPVLAGAGAYALSPDGRFVAYTWSGPAAGGGCAAVGHDDPPSYLTVRDIQSGATHTFTVAHDPSAQTPPKVMSLSWRLDDGTLAVSWASTGAIGGVAVVSPFANSDLFATSIPPCPDPGSEPLCLESGASYAANNSLSYSYVGPQTPTGMLNLGRWQDGAFQTIGVVAGTSTFSFDPANTALIAISHPDNDTDDYLTLWTTQATHSIKVTAPWANHWGIGPIYW